MKLAAKKSPLRIDTIIANKYRILRELGRGGMGTVYEAVHTGIGKHVALKFLECEVDRDQLSRARFLREAQTASLVESPHIVHVFDSGCSDDGTPFMVLELLRGEDLRARLRREGRLSVEDAVTIIEQTLRALVRTHAAGIVHRDLKPENIFLCDQDGPSILVKLLDFGISKVTRSEATLDTLTHEGVVLGTAYYMSPEQARGEDDLDGRSDLYGLGSIFFEMLAGRTPHVGNVYHAVLVDICTRDASDVRLLAPHISESIAKIIERALSRDREARYPNAEAFLDALAPHAQLRVSSADHLLESAKSRVSQPAPSQLTESHNGKQPDRFGARIAKLVASLLLLLIIGSAIVIVVVHERFKSQRAQRAAALLAQSPSVELGRENPREALNQATKGPLPAAPKPDPSPQPSALWSASPSGNRRMPGDAGTAIRRVSPRSSAGIAEDLRLKTTMP